MSTLIKTLKDNHTDMYDKATTEVELQQIHYVSDPVLFKLNKPAWAVVDTDNKRAIHLHGSNYQLVKYYKILNGLSDALDKYGITLNNTSIQFNVHPDLNYLKLRILFNDGSKFSPHAMTANPNDKLKFGIEVVSSYDASIVYQIRAMFLRLVCQNGMKSFESLGETVKKHTTHFDLDDSFLKLQHLETTFEKMQDKFEVYNSLLLTNGEVDSIFKQFSNGSDNKYNLLKNVLETDMNKSTLYDVYNALTNYSSHNKRAIRIGKKGNEDYRIDNSTMDAVRSNEARDSEIERYVSSDHFIFFYHKALANLGRKVS
tara:strand:+ start:155 stop:1099 length:945 start_codon:yes stop_codon:yes gene_type:complete